MIFTFLQDRRKSIIVHSQTSIDDQKNDRLDEKYYLSKKIIKFLFPHRPELVLKLEMGKDFFAQTIFFVKDDVVQKKRTTRIVLRNEKKITYSLSQTRKKIEQFRIVRAFLTERQNFPQDLNLF